jgi:hypothetical protein
MAQSFLRHLEFCYHPSQRERFQSGDLAPIWMSRYPELFDADDFRCTKTQPGKHFFEWLAAVLLRESTGYLSLVEKFDQVCHARKMDVFRRLVPTPVLDLIVREKKGTPDLFVYSSDGKHWFFGEVRGTRTPLNRTNSRSFRGFSN